jgi:hypothetical protein
MKLWIGTREQHLEAGVALKNLCGLGMFGVQQHSISGWWFQTFFLNIFHSIWDNPSR